MVAFVSAATSRVVTVNVALVAPAGTVTDAGTRATPSLLESRTSIPLAGALAVSVTVPSLFAPASTVAGVTENCTSRVGVGLAAAGDSSHALAQMKTSRRRTAQEMEKARITD
jgi:hypothetical protein